MQKKTDRHEATQPITGKAAIFFCIKATSLKNKIYDFQSCIAEDLSDVLTKHGDKNEQKDAKLSVSGYKHFKKDQSDERLGGGA